MEYIIETNELTKQYPGKLAVDHINMHIKKGDIYGFIGMNGAGKTTAMKMILGLTKVTSGSIKIYGSEDLKAGRRKIGSLIEAPGLYLNASAYENLKRCSYLYGGTEEEIREILKYVGLENTGNRLVSAFSLGMTQRLGIAIALLGNPEILVLDEPINGLDPEGILEIRNTLIRLNKEKGITILISSHLIDELAKITTVYGIIRNGQLVEEISSKELMEKCNKNILIRVDDVDRTLEILHENNFLGAHEVLRELNSIRLYSHYDESNLIIECLVKAGIKVYELSIGGDLEQFFIERMGR